MRNYYYVIIILFFSFSFVSGIRAKEKEEKTSGMDSIEIGPGASILVPEGTKKYQHKGVITLDDHNIHIAERFLGIEERLALLEAKETALEEQLSQISVSINKIKEDSKVFKTEEGSHEKE